MSITILAEWELSFHHYIRVKLATLTDLALLSCLTINIFTSCSWGVWLALWLGYRAECLCPYQNTCVWVLAPLLIPASCRCAPRDAVGEGSRTWVPDICMEDLEWVSARLSPGHRSYLRGALSLCVLHSPSASQVSSLQKDTWASLLRVQYSQCLRGINNPMGQVLLLSQRNKKWSQQGWSVTVNKVMNTWLLLYLVIF